MCDFLYNGNWYTEDQLREVFAQVGFQQTKASASTITKVKDWLNRVGIEIKTLDTGRFGGMNGVALLLDKVIQVAEGKENVTLTEEAMHFLTAMIKQGNVGLYNRMANKITTYDIYGETKKLYQDKYIDEQGNPDINKIKEEAIGKLLAEYYIGQNQGEDEVKIGQQKAWWERIIDWIKELLNIAPNPFKEALKQLGSQDILDTRSNEDVKNLASQIRDSIPDDSYFKGAAASMIDAGEYRSLVSEVAQQLADSNSYESMLSNLDYNESLVTKILDAYGQFLQTGEQWDLKKKFDDKIKQYDLQKKTDASDPDDENVSSYYTAKWDGVELKTDRTTDYAKRINKRTSKGVDYLEKATPAEKKEWARKALQGTTAHYNLEQIANAAFNADGTLKDRADVKVPPAVGINGEIHNDFVEYLLGTENRPGFLYKFPAGSKFLTEQQIFNDTAKFDVKDKDGNKTTLRGRAGTIDLLVQTPNGDVEIYDWKFMGWLLNKQDQDFLKRSQHAIQLSDYIRTLKEHYGIKNAKGFTIPIHAEYKDVKNKQTGETYPVLTTVTMGNTDFRKIEDTPLLPVTPDDQSTGNKKVDVLIKQLKARYQKLYKLKVGDDEYNEKLIDLNNQSEAIRSLQSALNFEPLSVEAKQFRNSLSALYDKYEKIDINSLTPDQKKSAIGELLNVLNAADYFSEVDKVFISEYGDENLSKEQQIVLRNLRQTSGAISEKRDRILDVLRAIVDNMAVNEGFNNILSPQKEAVGIINSLTERAYVNNKSVQLLTKLIVRARSQDKINTQKEIEKFQEIYLKVSKKHGNPFKLIADEKKHQLITKVKPDFYAEIDEAKKKKDKATILKNIDLAEYKKLATEAINKAIERVELRTYSTDEATDNRIKSIQKANARKTFDITSPDFNGYEDKSFGYLISKVLKTESQYTDAYKNMAKDQEVLDLYNYIFELNNRAKVNGYLNDRSSRLFLPFITGSMLQRLAASENKLSTLKGSFVDQFTVQVNEHQAYGRLDPETGEQDRSVPVYFTIGDKESTDYVKDLVRIIPRYIQALQEFETGKNLEDLFLSIHKIEQNKGHLEVDKKSGDIYFQGDEPLVFPGNAKNADLVKRVIDGSIYGISQDNDTAIDKLVGKFSKGKTEEEKDERAASTKKIIQQTNTLTQQLAVGMKALVAIPNFVGAFIQEDINSGSYYRRSEYKKNFFKMIASAFQGKEGNVEKALLHMIIPLNNDVARHKSLNIAGKESTLKMVSMWSFNDVMMSSNKLPDDAHQYTNAKTWLDNTMVVDGQLVNIQQYVRKGGRVEKYAKAESGEKAVKLSEKELKDKVRELKETKALKKVAKFNDKGELEIPGFDMEKGNLADYRTKVIEYGRYITGQMSRENKAGYRENIIATSFMMFKNWIPKQVSLRALDIHYNQQLEEWEYGRTRLFFKTWQHLGVFKIGRIRHILKATPEGIGIMREMLEQKRVGYYKKTGQKLEISEEEFFDMVRKELRSEFKELSLLLYIGAMVIGAKLALPPDDDEWRRNRNKTVLKAINKVSDELYFYWNPLSAESITRGTVLPSLGILTKVYNIMEHTTVEIGGVDWENRELFSSDVRDKNKVVKYYLDLLPIASQFEHELLPIVSPEAATNLGIRVTSESRPSR